MPAGSISGKLNLNGSGWSSAVEKAIRETKKLENATKSLGHGTVSQMQAASATIRTFEGGMANNTRAVERFITTIPGIGKALQAAFPVVGALATLGMLARIGDEVYKTAHQLSQIRNVANEAFGAMTLGAQHGADQLRVTNDRLEQQIAIMEHKPVNSLALALDEARLRADDLAKALQEDYKQFAAIVDESQKGIFTKLFNKGIDSDLGNQMKGQLANIRTLGLQQEKALKAGNQAGADDLARKLSAAQDAALAYADSEIAKRKGMVGMGTARQSTYAGTYGDQGTNFDAIDAFKTIVGTQQDSASQQKRNTAGEAREKADAAAAKAQEELLTQFQEGIAKQKAQFGVSVADELAYWSARIKAFGQGSTEYKTVLMDTYRLQADLYKELTEGKKKFLESSKGDVTGNDLLAAGAEAFNKDHLADLERAAKLNEKYSEEVAKGTAEQQKAATAFAESSVEMSVAQGTMSRLDAAVALAAIHQHDHAEAIERVNKALATQIGLINSDPKLSDEDKVGAVRNATEAAKNQTGQIDAQSAIQKQQDQQAIASQQLAPAIKQTLGTIANEWSNMTQSIVQIMTKSIDSLNDDIVKAMTGKGKAADFGKTFSQAGEGLLKASLQKIEGTALKGLGLGKPDGSKSNPWYVVNAGAGGSGAGGAGGGLSPFIRPFIGGKPQAGGGQGQDDDNGGGGSIWQKLGNAFLPGLFGKGGGAGDSGGADTGGDDDFLQGKFAGGGDFMANRPMLVGEEGPELLTPGMSGHITPNSQIGGGGDTHHHTTINVTGNQDPAAVNAAVRRALPHAVAASVQATHQDHRRRPGGHR